MRASQIYDSIYSKIHLGTRSRKSSQFVQHAVRSEHEEPTDHVSPNKSESFANCWEFVASAACVSVNVGSIWWIPHLIQANGGLAFVVAMTITSLVFGVPLVHLELVAGHITRLPLPNALPKLAPLFTGLGWCVWVLGAVMSVYQSLIPSWFLLYAVTAITDRSADFARCGQEWNGPNCTSALERVECSRLSSVEFLDAAAVERCGREGFVPATAEFFQKRVIGATIGASGHPEIGSLFSPITASFLVVWILIAALLFKGIRCTGKAVYVLALAPWMLCFLLLICLGSNGELSSNPALASLFVPDWSKLIRRQTWVEAAFVAFFAFGCGTGTYTNLASLLKFDARTSGRRSLLIVTLTPLLIVIGSTIFSLLAAVVSFGLAGQTGAVITSSGAQFAFESVTSGGSLTSKSAAWLTLFYIMSFFVCLGSQVMMVWSVLRSLQLACPTLGKRRGIFVLATTATLFSLGITMCSGIGEYLLTFLDLHSIYPLLMSSMGSILVISYVYGWYRWSRDLDVALGLGSGRLGSVLRAATSASLIGLAPALLSFLLWETAETWQVGASSTAGGLLFGSAQGLVSGTLTALPLILGVFGAAFALIRLRLFRNNEDAPGVLSAAPGLYAVRLASEAGLDGERFASPGAPSCGWSFRTGLIPVVFLETLGLCAGLGRVIWQLGWLSNAASELGFALLATVVLLSVIGLQAAALLCLTLGGFRKSSRLLTPYLLLQSASLGTLVGIASDTASAPLLSDGSSSRLHSALIVGVVVFVFARAAATFIVAAAHWEFREEQRSWDIQAVTQAACSCVRDLGSATTRVYSSSTSGGVASEASDGHVTLRLDADHFQSLLRLFQRAGEHRRNSYNEETE